MTTPHFPVTLSLINHAAARATGGRMKSYFDTHGAAWKIHRMKTATLHDLQTRLETVFAWVRCGEDVLVKGETAAPEPGTDPKVDWSGSGALRDRSGERFLNAEETAELYESYKGEY